MRNLAILIVLVAVACSPARMASIHLNKAKKHILKAEALGAEWGKDTIWNTIEIPVPEVVVDTSFILLDSDTVVIEKERLVVRVVRKLDTLRVEGKCVADTIIKKVPVRVNNEIEVIKPAIPWWIWFIISVMGLAVMALIFKR